MGKYDHVQARTDDDIGDEEAGRMRAQLAEESRSRKAAEAARIKKANEENRKRLAGITARTDDGDGLIGGGSPGSSPGTSPWKLASRSQSPKRDELGEVRDLLQQRFKDRVKANIRKNPVQVGFGIRSHEDAKRMVSGFQGVIIGSALIDAIRTAYPAPDWMRTVSAFVRSITQGPTSP